MNGTEESNGPQRNRYVLFRQIAIVEPMSCHPSASVQADSKTRTAKTSRGNHKYGKQETRRKIIRQWASLPKDKRQTAEQAAEFAKKAIEQNKLQRNRWAGYRHAPAGDDSAE